jgi:hypothetical protein
MEAWCLICTVNVNFLGSADGVESVTDKLHYPSNSLNGSARWLIPDGILLASDVSNLTLWEDCFCWAGRHAARMRHAGSGHTPFALHQRRASTSNSSITTVSRAVNFPGKATSKTSWTDPFK